MRGRWSNHVLFADHGCANTALTPAECLFLIPRIDLRLPFELSLAEIGRRNLMELLMTYHLFGNLVVDGLLLHDEILGQLNGDLGELRSFLQ